MKKKNIFNFFKIIFGIAIILFLLFKIDYSYITKIDFKSNIEYLLLSFLSFFFSLILIQSLRLNILLDDFKVGLHESFKLVVIGSFFNSFLPSNIGGDGYKVIFLKNKFNLSLDKSFSLIFIERLSGLLILFLMGVFYIIFFWERLYKVLESNKIVLDSRIYYIISFFLLLFTTIGVALLIRPNWTKKILQKIKKNIKSSINFIANIDSFIYLKVILYSIIFHFFRLLGFYFLVIFFNSQIYWPDLLFVLSVTAFISMIPITIGAIGLREGIISILLILFGVAENEAISIALLNRLILLMITITGAYFYVNSDYKVMKKSTNNG